MTINNKIGSKINQKLYIKYKIAENAFINVDTLHIYIHAYISYISGAKPIASIICKNKEKTKPKEKKHTHINVCNTLCV